jgi:hypothetical protein
LPNGYNSEDWNRISQFRWGCSPSDRFLSVILAAAWRLGSGRAGFVPIWRLLLKKESVEGEKLSPGQKREIEKTLSATHF